MNADELRSLRVWSMLQRVTDKDIEQLAGIDGLTESDWDDVISSIKRCLQLDAVPASFNWDALEAFRMGCYSSSELSDDFLYYGVKDAELEARARQVVIAFWCMLVHNSLHDACEFAIQEESILNLVGSAFVLGLDWLLSVHQLLLFIVDRQAVLTVHPAVQSAAIGLASLLLAIVSFRNSCAHLYATHAADSSRDEAQDLQLDLVQRRTSPEYLLWTRGWPSELRNAQRVAEAAAVLAQQIGDAFAADLRNA